MKRQIAIFGGSFNPPHIGHQTLCLMLLETCPVDEVWLVPTYRHYLGKDLADFSDRMQMCQRLLLPLDTASTRVDPVERDLPDPQGRMLDTLQALEQAHPDVGFRLVIGADILQQTNRWYRFSEVAALAPPLVFGRVGYPGGELPAPPDVSSSEIRERLAKGQSVTPLVPRGVLQYIQERGLYQCESS